MREYTGCVDTDLRIGYSHDPELVRIVTELAKDHLAWTFGDQPEAVHMITSAAATPATIREAFWTYDLADFFPDKVVHNHIEFWRLLIVKYRERMLLVQDQELRKICSI